MYTLFAVWEARTEKYFPNFSEAAETEFKAKEKKYKHSFWFLTVRGNLPCYSFILRVVSDWILPLLI